MIWINGAFGAGKTTLADELHLRLPDALAFDPEYVGYILTRWVPAPESGDFQDIPLVAKAGRGVRDRPVGRVPQAVDRSNDPGQRRLPEGDLRADQPGR